MKFPATGTAPAFRYRQQFGVIVLCSDEQEQRGIYEQLQRKGLRLRVVTV